MFIAEAVALGDTQHLGGNVIQARIPHQFAFQRHHLRQLVEPPAVNARRLRHLIGGVSGTQGFPQRPHALGARHRQRFQPTIPDAIATGWVVRARQIQRLQPFEQRFLERAPNRHHFADALHLRSQCWVNAGELLERPAGDFGHHVVNTRLERRHRGAGNVVADFVQRVPHRQQRRNLGNGEARRFAGQCR